jgi:hypothetical protein
MADGILSTLTRRADDWRGDAEDYGREAGRRLRRGSEDTRSELRRLWSQLEDVVDRQVAPRASEYARTARAYAEEGRDRASDAADYIRDAARARPLVAIGVAVAATWLVASLISRGRR